MSIGEVYICNGARIEQLARGITFNEGEEGRGADPGVAIALDFAPSEHALRGHSLSLSLYLYL